MTILACMKTIFIFHGIYGNPDENWFPWMKAALEKAGHRVIVPEFPNPEKPVLDEWMTFMVQYEKDIGEDAVFIGHSLGAAFALRFITNMNKPIATTFLVAPVWCVMGNEFDPQMSSFTQAPYNWAAIKKSCTDFHVFLSDNDPYIKASLSEELANHLGADATMVTGAGHFNQSAGYTSFPLLLERVLAS